IPPHRPEQRTLQILTMSGNSQVVSDPLYGLLVNGERPFLATLAHHPERLIPTVLMQLPHLQARDLRATEPALQPDRQDGTIPQPYHSVRRGLVENRPRLRLGERKRHPFPHQHAPCLADGTHVAPGERYRRGPCITWEWSGDRRRGRTWRRKRRMNSTASRLIVRW